MSGYSDPNTSLNGNRRGKDTQVSESQQVGLEGLQQHMDAIAETANQLTSSMPVCEPAGKYGNNDFYMYYRALLAESEIRLTDEIEEPITCLEILEGDQSITAGTLGNFFLIVGKAKSRKTYLLSAMVAALVKVDTVMGKLRGWLPEDKRAILYFDTEQHKGHVKRVLKRISALSGHEQLNTIRVYQLKKHGPDHRLNAIRVAIEDTPNLGLIVIDGIRDTVFDINDAREATQRATDLLQWTEEKDAHLITVIHENKGNGNARGHLGSELVNKAETVISVGRDPNDKDVSIVTGEFCRDKEFEPFGFSIGEDGLPYLVDGHSVGDSLKPKSRKATAGNLKIDEVENVVRRAFANDEQLRYSQLRTNIMEASEYMGNTLGKTKAEELIQRLQTDKYVLKFRPAKERYEVYQINPEKLPGQLS